MRLFGRATEDRSAHGLLAEAGGNVVRATTLLRDLVADYPEHADLARRIRECEQEGDRITHDLIHLLGGGARAGLPSDQVQALARTIDDIVDYADETADIMGLYRIEASMAQAEELADVLVASGEAVAAALDSLAGDGVDLSARLVEIHRLENEGDRVSREAIASLFAGGIDPMVVIRWKDVFESLEEAIDSCESVAHLLEGIALQFRGR